MRTVRRPKKIVYVQYQPITLAYEKDYHIDLLKRNGFDIEYWDVTKIFFHNLSIVDSIGRDYEVHLTSYDELEKQIRKENLDETIFINQITYERKVVRLFRLFSKYGCVVYRFYVGALPTDARLTKKIRNNLNWGIFLKIFDKSIPIIYKKLKLIAPYHTVFAAGGASVDLFRRTSRVIPINLFDYDKFLLAKNYAERMVKEKYCVYLDDNWASHPDVAMLGLPTLNAETHYDTLRTFFDSIERIHKLKVVIAAHPKSAHPLENYGNREVVKYKTAELVKDAEFALTTISTAMSYAVLFKKPLVFFFTEEIREKYSHDLFPDIVVYARMLGSNLVDANQYRDDELVVNPVDELRYQSYKYGYLTSPEAENFQTSDIVLKHFQDPSLA